MKSLDLRPAFDRVPDCAGYSGKSGNIRREPAGIVPPDSAGFNQIAFLSPHTRFGSHCTNLKCERGCEATGGHIYTGMNFLPSIFGYRNCIRCGKPETGGSHI